MATEVGKLFVGGISRSTSSETLRAHFSRHGQLKECDVIKDRITGHSRGFGFVGFVDPSAADAALQEDHIILGRKVEVRHAKPKEKYPNHRQLQRNQTNKGTSTDGCNKKKIFVGGIPHNLTDEELKSYFNSFGTIVDAVVIRDKEYNKPRGFGFVTFDSEEAVDNVFKQRFHELKNKRVEAKMAVPKEDMSYGHMRGPSNLRAMSNDSGVDERNDAYNRGLNYGIGPMCCPTNFGSYILNNWAYADSLYGGLIFYANPLFYICLNCGAPGNGCLNCGAPSNGWFSTNRPYVNIYDSCMSRPHDTLKLENIALENQNGANKKESNATKVRKENEVIRSHEESYVVETQKESKIDAHQSSYMSCIEEINEVPTDSVQSFIEHHLCGEKVQKAEIVANSS